MERKANLVRRYFPTAPETDPTVQNYMLLGLPRSEYQIVFPKLELVRLQTHHVLHEAGDTLKSAYFCNTGLISILSVMADGKSVAVGVIGKEGFVGVPLVAGFRTSPTRALAQIQGTAFRIDADALVATLRECRTLERELQRLAQILAMQAAQIAGCNRLHEVDERLARWLLMSSDRVESNSLPLTHDLMAQMLGTRRSSVTVAAGMLQKAGIIAHARGDVEIIDRRKLESVACECYEIMRRQVEEWKGHVEQC